MRRFIFALCIATCAFRAHASITLTAPAPHATLRGEQFATIAWASDRDIDAEEWEAFLSVDGGAYYAVRVTPHLDLKIRTFQFVVPNVASASVRILMRVGDERNEKIIEFPQTFSIVASPSVEAGGLARHSAAPESARPGEAPVVQWASGPRSGGSVSIVRATCSDAAICASIREPLTRPSATLSPRRGTRGYIVRFAQVVDALAQTPRSRVASNDVLRLTRRLNV